MEKGRIVILLCFVNLILSANARTLMVLCQKEFIRVTVLLDDPNFFGLVYTRPNRNTCSVWGAGEQEINLFVPLSDPGRTDCGVVFQNSHYTAVIDVRQHHLVEMASDSSFVVQCSADEIAQPSNSPKAQIILNVLHEDEIVKQTTVGTNYALEVQLPDSKLFQAVSCLAFTGSDTIRIIPLTDEKGCPIDDMITTPFYNVERTDRVRAEITMFRFNDSNQLYLQCVVVHCEEGCIQPFCRPTVDADNLQSAHKPLAQNRLEAMTAARVTVTDTSGVQKLIQEYPCQFASDMSLVTLTVLLASLVMLTVLSCSFAVYNRPFKCQVQSRDEPLTLKNMIEIGDPMPCKQKQLRFQPLSLLALPPPEVQENKEENVHVLQINTLSSVGSCPPKVHFNEEHNDEIHVNLIEDNSETSTLRSNKSSTSTIKSSRNSYNLVQETPSPPKKRAPTPPMRINSIKFPSPPPPLKMLGSCESFPPPPSVVAKPKRKPTPPPRTVFARSESGYAAPDEMRRPIMLERSETLDARPKPKARKVGKRAWFFDV